MESSSNEWNETNDSLWQFADSLDISRFEHFGLSEATRFRLDALRRNVDVFGIHAEKILPLAAGNYGCLLYLYGRQFSHCIMVDGDEEPVKIQLHTCELDQPEAWTFRFEGRDSVGCWFYLLQKIAKLEDVGFFGTEDMFQVPR